MSPRARRVALAALGVPGLALVTLVASATPAAAHALDGEALPAPTWLLGYLGAFAVLATAVALRASWASARLGVLDDEVDGTGDAGPGPRVTVGALVALLLLVGTFVAAVAGEADQAANVAPRAVFVAWWVGLPLLCLVVGDVLRVANPFVPVVALAERVLPRRATAGRPAPAWTAAALLWGVRWVYLAYHEPGSPGPVAVLLAGYTVAAVAGGWWWGRAWLRTGEGFGALSSAVAGLRRGRARLPGPTLLALAVAWLGTTAFDAVASTGFWADVVGTSQGWTRTLLNTVGLVWATGVVAAAALAVVRVVDREDDGGDAEPTEGRRRPPAWLVSAVGIALLALALVWFVAHDLTLLLFEGQNLLVLLSDPLGRGWDLFGTIDHDVDVGVLEAGWVQAVQLGALLLGHVGAVVLAHDAALSVVGRRRAWAVTAAVAGLAAASAVLAPMLVLA